MQTAPIIDTVDEVRLKVMKPSLRPPAAHVNF